MRSSFRPAVFWFWLLWSSHAPAQQQLPTQQDVEESIEARVVRLGEDLFTLRHRWELDPDLDASWMDVPAVPLRLIDLRNVQSNNELDCIAEAQHICKAVEQIGIRDPQSVLQAVLLRLQSANSRPSRLALLSAAVAIADFSGSIDVNQEKLDQEDKKLLGAQLWEFVAADPVARRSLEPVLVKWGCPVALETWRDRIREQIGSASELIVAVNGLGACGESADIPALESIAMQSAGLSSVRFVAAKSLGGLTASDLETTARVVLKEATQLSDLLAAHMLRQHSSPQARDMLLQILTGNSRAAQLIAFRSLAHHWPESLSAYVATMAQHPDNLLRLAVVEVLAKLTKSDSVGVLGELLQDPNESVRVAARKALEAHSKRTELRTGIDEVVTYRLREGNEFGIEQAILLCAALDDRTRSPDLIRLLDHEKPRVNVAAAWGLQELAQSTDTLSAIEARIRSISDAHFLGQEMSEVEGFQVSYLIEALGRNDVSSANRVLKKYVPKYAAPAAARASAIWTLGYTLPPEEHGSMVVKFAKRMLDPSEDYPEEEIVRFVCAIAMGTMGDKSAVKHLDRCEEIPPFPLGKAKHWALKRLGDE